MDLRFSLLLMPLTMGFHYGPGTNFTTGSKLYPDPRRREVGCGFCSVTADLHLSTGAYGPVTFDNATVPVAELLVVIFLVERSVGPIHIHSDCKYVCSGKDKITQRTERGAHVTLLDKIAASFVETPGSCGDFMVQSPSDNFHQVAMTPKILVGSAVADAFAKKSASVFLAVNDCVKMDQITWAVQQRIYATSILAAQAAPRSASAHLEDVLLGLDLQRSKVALICGTFGETCVCLHSISQCDHCEYGSILGRMP